MPQRHRRELEVGAQGCCADRSAAALANEARFGAARLGFHSRLLASALLRARRQRSRLAEAFGADRAMRARRRSPRAGPADRGGERGRGAGVGREQARPHRLRTAHAVGERVEHLVALGRCDPRSRSRAGRRLDALADVAEVTSSTPRVRRFRQHRNWPAPRCRARGIRHAGFRRHRSRLATPAAATHRSARRLPLFNTEGQGKRSGR